MAHTSFFMGISRFALALVLAAAGAAPAVHSSNVEVSSGTLVSIELVDPVHSGKNKDGDAFRARLLDGVWVRGAVAVAPGSTVRGRVLKAVPSGRIRGQARLELSLDCVEMDGRSYPLRSDTLSYAGDPHAGRHIGSWIAGALQGALYGVLFGGEKGAIIGAGAGAGTGAAAAVIKGKQDVEFQPGAKLTFELTAPVTVPAFPAKPAAQDGAPRREDPKPAG